MKPALCKYLRCMNCQSALEVKAIEHLPVTLTDEEKSVLQMTGRTIKEYETEILTGRLHCTACSAQYPIARGVPRMYRGAEKHFPTSAMTEALRQFKHQNEVQTSFTREWDELNYDDGTIWLWNVDERIDTFCEELDIPSPDVLRGKLMIDAGCGSGILSMNLANRYSIEVLALDISYVLDRAFQVNRSNLCHFIQTTVLDPPIAEEIADVTYSHGVLHHTYDTKAAFDAIAKLTRQGGILYVWLYGKKKGWNRFRFVFIRSARFIIARLPKLPQTMMIYVMTGIHLSVRFLKRVLGLEKVQYKTLSQFLVSMRDKYTPLYAREYTEAEIKEWFREAGYAEVDRRTQWEKTPWWKGSTDLSVTGRRQ